MSTPFSISRITTFAEGALVTEWSIQGPIPDRYTIDLVQISPGPFATCHIAYGGKEHDQYVALFPATQTNIYFPRNNLRSFLPRHCCPDTWALVQITAENYPDHYWTAHDTLRTAALIELNLDDSPYPTDVLIQRVNATYNSTHWLDRYVNQD